MNGREWTTEDLTEIAKLEEECFSDPWSQRMLADSFLSDGFFGSLLEERKSSSSQQPKCIAVAVGAGKF